MAGNQEGGYPPAHALTDSEVRFLVATIQGDHTDVRTALQNRGDVDVTCTDTMGRNALLLAAQNGHINIVKTLLQTDECKLLHLEEALLVAVAKNDLRITDVLVKAVYDDRLDDEDEEDRRISRASSSQFPEEMTATMLAAQLDRTEILNILVTRGLRVPNPHDYLCSCQVCVDNRNSDSFGYARRRLNTYRALASPTYISLTCRDPIARAFHLTEEIRKVTSVEPEHKEEYRRILTKLETFVSELLDHCRSREEMVVTVGGGEGEKGHKTSPGVGRLQTAVQCNQQKFISHPLSQHCLQQMWHSRFQTWRQLGWVLKLLVSVGIALTLPVLALIYWLMPTGKFGKWLKTPVVKCIMYLASYVAFLVFVCLVTVEKLTSPQLDNVQVSAADYNLPQDLVGGATFLRRSTFPGVIQWLLSIWVLGFLWQEVKQLYHMKWTWYWKSSPYKLIDLLSLTLYITHFVLVYVMFYFTSRAENYFKQEDRTALLRNKDGVATLHLYHLVGDRDRWNSGDPLFVAESLFAFANVLSFLRLGEFLVLNNSFGALSITVERCIPVIVKFLLMLLLVAVGFLFAIFNLYFLYSGNIHITSLDTTFSSLLQIVTGSPTNLLVSSERSAEVTGWLLYGTYYIIVAIAVFSLIAVVFNHATCSDEKGDYKTQLKFAQARLYLSFIRRGTLPPPLNLVPTPKSVWYAARAVYRHLCCCCNKRKTQEMSGADVEIGEDITENLPAQSDRTYQIAQQHVVQRYLVSSTKQRMDWDWEDDDTEMLHLSYKDGRHPRKSHSLTALVERQFEHMVRNQHEVFGNMLGHLEQMTGALRGILSHLQVVESEVKESSDTLKKKSTMLKLTSSLLFGAQPHSDNGTQTDAAPLHVDQGIQAEILSSPSPQSSASSRMRRKQGRSQTGSATSPTGSSSNASLSPSATSGRGGLDLLLPLDTVTAEDLQMIKQLQEARRGGTMPTNQPKKSKNSLATVRKLGQLTKTPSDRRDGGVNGPSLDGDVMNDISYLTDPGFVPGKKKTAHNKANGESSLKRNKNPQQGSVSSSKGSTGRLSPGMGILNVISRKLSSGKDKRRPAQDYVISNIQQRPGVGGMVSTRIDDSVFDSESRNSDTSDEYII
ncbi:short transient receptor potential channel 7-like isoform X1 [Branchiostoma floridae x Branchiostoma belcheri]